MNKFFFLITLVCLQLNCLSQNELYQKIKHIIQEKHPELDLHSKLIGCVIWSVNDADSREQVKSFDKALKVFENAKLKGGSKGIVMLAVNKENLSTEVTIVLQKDSVFKLIPVKSDELVGVDWTSLQNVVYDSDGKKVYVNLNNTEVFSSINKLITR